MRFIKWLATITTVIALVAFIAIHLIADSCTSLKIALPFALLYAVITVICEGLWRRYNNRI